MEKSAHRLSPRSILVGVIVLVLVVGGLATGSYYIYKNSIQASTPATSCNITLKSLKVSGGQHGDTVYITKKNTNISSQAGDVITKLSSAGQQASVPANTNQPLYAVGKAQAGVYTADSDYGALSVVSSGQFICDGTNNFEVNADLYSGKITVTSVTGGTTGQTTGGQSTLTQGNRTAKITVTVKDQYGQIIPEGVEIYFNPKDASGNAQQAQHCTTTAQANGSCSSDVFFTRAGTVLIKAVRGPESAEQSLSYTTDDPVNQNIIITLGTASQAGGTQAETKDLNFLVVNGNGKPVNYAQVLATIGSIGTDYKKKIVYENTCNTPANSGQCTIKGVPKPDTTQTVQLEVIAVKAGLKGGPILYTGWDSIKSTATITITIRGLSDDDAKKYEAPTAAGVTPFQVPVVGNNLPLGNSSVTFQAVRISLAGENGVAPIGSVKYAMDIKVPQTFINSQQTQQGANTTNTRGVLRKITSSAFAQTPNVNIRQSPTTLTTGTPTAAGTIQNETPTNTIPLIEEGGTASGTVTTNKPSSQIQGKTYTIEGSIPDNGTKSKLRLDKLPPGEYALTLSKDSFNSARYYFTILQDGSQLNLGGLTLQPEQRYRYLLFFTQNRDIEPPSIGSGNVYFWYGGSNKENEYRTLNPTSNNSILRYYSRKAPCGWQNTGQTYREDCNIK